MIIVKLLGGLGNQMFQIAFAKSLAIDNNEDIFIDTSVYSNYKIRDFALSNLVVSDSVHNIEQLDLKLKEKIYLSFTQKTYHIFQKIFKIIGLRSYLGKSVYEFLTKRGLYYNFTPYHYNHMVNDKELKCLYGYFQSEKYFSNIKLQIGEMLDVKVELTEEEKKIIAEIDSCNSVGVSIRIGSDYVNSSSWNVCTNEYYHKGMEYIHKRHPNAIFYIFSDDIQKVKTQFSFSFPVRYVEGFKDYESLRILYTCKHFVISNSSFSWWGAYLSKNREKIVIAPERWNNKFEKKSDIYVDDMILIKP